MQEEAEELGRKVREAEACVEQVRQSCSERVEEFEELLDFQEADLEKKVAAAKKAEAGAVAALKRVKPPSVHQWESLSEGGVRWARKTD
eukprot:3610310-Pleurochrysis_carterae.AAC.1